MLAIGLVVVAWLVTVPATLIVRAIGRRMNALDGPGVAGQVKAASRRVPNTGGIAIMLGIALPMLAGLLVTQSPPETCPVQANVPELVQHMPGLRATADEAIVLLAGLLVLHVMGVLDDRQPLGPWVKLMVLLGVTGAVVWWTDTRLLTLLDGRLGGAGMAASIVVTVLWIVVVTNAMNFLDNMDGLSAGVGAIAGACFLAAAIVHGQWFVASMLAVLVGACGGFLVFNFPWRAKRDGGGGGGAGGATIFMGDGGSLVIGFLLGFLTVRTTYYAPDAAGGWYGVFMPLVVLAIPLYDFVSVVVIRLSQGKSPLVGDLQHLSHRLVRRGLSKRAAVLVIHGLTAITAIGGIALGSLEPWQAVLVGVQTVLVLAVLAVFEHRAAVGGAAAGTNSPSRDADSRGGPA